MIPLHECSEARLGLVDGTIVLHGGEDVEEAGAHLCQLAGLQHVALTIVGPT